MGHHTIGPSPVNQVNNGPCQFLSSKMDLWPAYQAACLAIAVIPPVLSTDVLAVLALVSEAKVNQKPREPDPNPRPPAIRVARWQARNEYFERTTQRPRTAPIAETEETKWARLPTPDMDLHFPYEVVTTRLILARRHASEALELKALTEANLDHLRAWMAWAMDEPSPLDVVEARLVQFEKDFNNGVQWAYGIRLKTDHRLIGAVGVHPRIGPTGVEIGYWLAANACGNGFATEVVKALTHLALHQPAIDHVQIWCDPNNIRSIGIPKRLGYSHVATLVNDTVTPLGAPRDTMIWQLNRADYDNARRNQICTNT